MRVTGANALLLQYRRDNDLSQTEAGACCGVCQTAWSEIERLDGDRIQPTAIRAIATLIGVSIRDMIPLKLHHKLLGSATRVEFSDVSMARLLANTQFDHCIVPDPSVDAERVEVQETVRAMLAPGACVLRPRERIAVLMRFGIGCSKRFKLVEIGDKLSVSRARVEQILQTAFDTLRRPVNNQRLRGLFDAITSEDEFALLQISRYERDKRRIAEEKRRAIVTTNGRPKGSDRAGCVKACQYPPVSTGVLRWRQKLVAASRVRARSKIHSGDRARSRRRVRLAKRKARLSACRGRGRVAAFH